MEFFVSEKISDSTTRIVDITGVYCYLVEGSEKAALIDTATGTGDLRTYVETLTDKPVSVILTHGHCDHASGAAWFEDVYLSEEDYELVKFHASMEMKKGYVEFTRSDIFSKLIEEDFCPVRTKGYKPLKDGQCFYLGGVTLEAIALPGHTRGMTCILNQEERSVLLGDACNHSVFLWDQESLTVEEYKKSLVKFKSQEDRYDKVYFSHSGPAADKTILDGVIQVCDDIMKGIDDSQPFLFMGNELRLAKAADEQNVRLDGKHGNIVYNPAKILK